MCRLRSCMQSSRSSLQQRRLAQPAAIRVLLHQGCLLAPDLEHRHCVILLQVGGREAGISKSSSNTEFWYDVAGWGLLVAIGVAWVALAKTNAAAPPPAK